MGLDWNWYGMVLALGTVGGGDQRELRGWDGQVGYKLRVRYLGPRPEGLVWYRDEVIRHPKIWRPRRFPFLLPSCCLPGPRASMDLSHARSAYFVSPCHLKSPSILQSAFYPRFEER